MQDKQVKSSPSHDRRKDFRPEATSRPGSVRQMLLCQLLPGMGLALSGFLLGKCTLLFGARPLGIGLLCAASSGVLWVLAGLMLSALTGENAAFLVCTYLAALLIRVLAKTAIGDDAPPSSPRTSHAPAVSLVRYWRSLFRESVYLRMMTACVTAFIVSLYTIIAGGFLYYDLFGALLSMVVAPTATFLYAGLFPPVKSPAWTGRKPWSREKVEILRTAGWSALTFSLLFALRDASLFGADSFGISASVFLGFFITLCVSRRRGSLWGMVCSLICALGAAPSLTPSFAVGALCYASLPAFSLLLGTSAAFGFAVAWDIYLNRLAALSTTMPAFLAASLLAMGIDQLITSPDLLERLTAGRRDMTFAGDVTGGDRAGSCEAELNRARMVQGEETMRRMSQAFTSLSQVFYSLSDRLRRPGMLDLRRMCDEAFDCVCPNCPKRDLCWGAEYSVTLTTLSHIAGVLHQAGRLSPEDVDGSFRGRCPSWEELIRDINARCAMLTEYTLHTEKAEIFAADYAGLSDLLCDALAEQEGEFVYDEPASRRVGEALRGMDMSPGSVLVYGTRQRKLIAGGLRVSAAGISTSAVHDRLEAACGFRLGEVYVDFAGDGVTLRAATCPTVSARHVLGAQSGSDEACGDTVNAFVTDKDYYYAYICDGMGTGRDAAFTSGVCGMFLEKMLTAGNRVDTSLKMLSDMVRQKGGGLGVECSSTVDLLELDLLTGRAVFHKCGAAPTFIKRGSDVFKLSARTAPIGILRSVDVKKISYDVHKGDYIIMVSDGVTQGDDQPDWLISLLSENWDSESGKPEVILSAARTSGSSDDISVIILRVCGAEE